MPDKRRDLNQQRWFRKYLMTPKGSKCVSRHDNILSHRAILNTISEQLNYLVTAELLSLCGCHPAHKWGIVSA